MFYSTSKYSVLLFFVVMALLQAFAKSSSKWHYLGKLNLYQRTKFAVSLLPIRYNSWDLQHHQDSLPTFPVPPLRQTLEKYLQHYKVHVSLEEYERAKQVVEKFGKTGGKGELLQKMLEKRKDETENWLFDWWIDFYLKRRESTPLNHSPCFQVQSQNLAGLDQQLEYASKITTSVARLVSLLVRHRYPPIIINGTPMCMTQLYNTFSSCRIPGHNMDMPCYHRIDEPNAPNHIVVIRNNHFFKFDILNKERQPISTSNILQQLKSLVDRSDDLGIPVGLLTAQDKEPWAKVYSNLNQDEVNKQTFEDIRSSIFILCLDSTKHFTDKIKKDSYDAKWVFCGGGSKENSGNRWFDHSISIFVGSYGEAGVVADRLVSDGLIAHIIADTMFQATYQKEEIATNTDSKTNLPPPTKLEFVLNEGSIQAIRAAGERIDEALNNMQIVEKRFKFFGKKALQKHNIKHDAFVQVALQMAYWRIHCVLPVVTEPSSLQMFKQGRIEHMRTVTKESAEFVKCFTDKNVKPTTKLLILREALDVHRNISEETKKGQGMEGHIYGLQRLAEESGIDVSEFFDDPSWHKHTSVEISSANIPGNIIKSAFIPTPPILKRLSISYFIRDDYIKFNASIMADKSVIDVKKFVDIVCESLNDMKELLEHESIFN